MWLQAGFLCSHMHLLTAFHEKEFAVRPKHLLLCVCSDEQRLSELSFILRTHAYNVATFSTAGEALTYAANGYFDGAIITPWISDMGAEELAIRLRTCSRSPSLLLLKKDQQLTELYAGAHLPHNFTAADMLQTLKAILQKKRGPIPGTPRPPRSTDVLIPAVAV